MKLDFVPNLQRSWIAAGSAVLSAGVGIFKGSQQKKEAQKQLDALKNPDYTIPQEVLDNQKRAQMRANSGLPSAQYQKAQQDIQRNRNAAIAANADMRGGVGVIGAIQGQSDDAANNLNVADAQQKIANEKTLYGINQDVAGYKDKKWAAEKDNYDRDYNYAMSLKGAGNQQIMNGIDSGLAGLVIGGNAAMEKSGGNLFGKSKNTQLLTPTSRVNGTNYYNNNTPTSKTYSKFQTPDFGEEKPIVAPRMLENNQVPSASAARDLIPFYFRKGANFLNRPV